MWCQNAFHEGNDVCTMKKIQLACVFFEDLGEAELLNCAPPIIRRVEGDMCRSARNGVLGGRLNGEEAVGTGDIRLWWTKPQKDLEEVVRLLLRGARGRGHGVHFAGQAS